MLYFVRRFFFKHLSELFILSGLLLLLAVAAAGWYTQWINRSQITHAHINLKTLVDALQIYSYDHPYANVFPPENAAKQGIVLAPVRDNNLNGLAFLTTPTAYVSALPVDPFMKQSMGKEYKAPAVLHWVKNEENNPFTHIAWGAMSIGPALHLPPQYSIRVLDEVPYSAVPLNRNLFNPSNGLHSLGILYHDSLGNSNSL